ncbi:putative translation initiation factor IF-2 [uncultured archaeon]|nr:putative translation initiation factor IF-2 [uncultured archaeon]
MFIRSPIIAVLGHVDNGKTSLLDAIRGTGFAKKEAGGITQMIGASYVPKENIEAISRPIAEKMKIKLIVPGILFIDTPGHEAFTNLRERGGSIADMAILVVDIAQGFQPQTIESIKILKNAKTPFVIAANKLDLVNGWKTHKTDSFLESLALQPEHVQGNLDTKVYELVGKLAEFGFDSERFDRVRDFTKQLAIVPVSAKTHEGLSELLLFIAGLSQRFLEKELNLHPDISAKGSVIEVKDEIGMGPTIDVIIYDGVLREGDEIIFLAKAGVKITKVRALLQPNISGGKEKFRRVAQVAAAAGVKISAPGLEDTISGSPVMVTTNYERDKGEIEAQMKSIIFESEELGVVVKADSLGSVEAILKLLRDAEIPVKAADVGNVTKGDVLLASTVASEDKYAGAVLAFNVQVLSDAKSASDETRVPIIYSNIVYQLLDRYEEWKTEEREREKKEVLEKMPWPCRIKALPGFFFRANKPAIFGIEVLAGKLKPHVRLMNKQGVILGEIKTIQKEKESLPEAEKGVQAAISVDEITLNRDIREGDVLLVYMTKDELEKWKKKADALSQEENDVLMQVEDLVSVRI